MIKDYLIGTLPEKKKNIYEKQIKTEIVDVFVCVLGLMGQEEFAFDLLYQRHYDLFGLRQNW